MIGVPVRFDADGDRHMALVGMELDVSSARRPAFARAHPSADTRGRALRGSAVMTNVVALSPSAASVPSAPRKPSRRASSKQRRIGLAGRVTRFAVPPLGVFGRARPCCSRPAGPSASSARIRSGWRCRRCSPSWGRRCGTAAPGSRWRRAGSGWNAVSSAGESVRARGRERFPCFFLGAREERRRAGTRR